MQCARTKVTCSVLIHVQLDIHIGWRVLSVFWREVKRAPTIEQFNTLYFYSVSRVIRRCREGNSLYSLWNLWSSFFWASHLTGRSIINGSRLLLDYFHRYKTDSLVDIFLNRYTHCTSRHVLLISSCPPLAHYTHSERSRYCVDRSTNSAVLSVTFELTVLTRFNRWHSDSLSVASPVMLIFY